MSDPLPAELSAADSPRRSWAFLAGVVGAWAVFNVALNPAVLNDSSNPSAVQVLLVGATIVQPCLLSLWAVFGPPPVVARLLLSILALAVVMLVRPIWEWLMAVPPSPVQFPEHRTVVAMVAMFFAGLVPGAALRWITGWRLVQHDAAPTPADAQRQFSIKYLLIITTLVAVLLAIVRGVGWASGVDLDDVRRSFQNGWQIEFGVFLVLLFPMAVGALVSLQPRPSALSVLLAVIGVVASTFTAFAIVATAFSTMPPEITVRMLLIQFGAAVFCLANVVVLRLAGYLVERSMKPARSTDAGNPLH